MLLLSNILITICLVNISIIWIFQLIYNLYYLELTRNLLSNSDYFNIFYSFCTLFNIDFLFLDGQNTMVVNSNLFTVSCNTGDAFWRKLGILDSDDWNS